MKLEMISLLLALTLAIIVPQSSAAQGLLDDPILDIPEFPLEDDPLESPNADTSASPTDSSTTSTITVADSGTGLATSLGMTIVFIVSASTLLAYYTFRSREDKL